MLKMAVGHTEELDGEYAAEEILKQCTNSLEGLEPQAGLLLASHDLDLEEFIEAVLSAFPDIALVGCTTIGPMSSASSYIEGSTTLTLFASDVLEFTAGLGTAVATDAGNAARQAIEEAASKTDKDPALVIVTPTVENFDPAVIVIEIGNVLGPTVPVFGGGAVPDFPIASPWEGGIQIYGRQVVQNSIPVLLVSGPLNVSVGVAHGWSPVGRTAVVTRSDHHTIYEIDGAPVTDFYRHYLGATTVPAIANPLAILDEDTQRYYLRAPMTYNDEDGSATFLGSIPEGSTVRLAMATTDEILDGTDASINEALATFPDGADPEAVLVSSCAVRNILLGSQTGGEIERIRSGIGEGVPITGFYAYGEIAPLGTDSTPRFHNETCVTVLIGT
jgi:hypothetical protein